MGKVAFDARAKRKRDCERKRASQLESQCKKRRDSPGNSPKNEHSVKFPDGVFFRPNTDQKNIVVSQPSVVLERLNPSLYPQIQYPVDAPSLIREEPMGKIQFDPPVSRKFQVHQNTSGAGNQCFNKQTASKSMASNRVIQLSNGVYFKLIPEWININQLQPKVVINKLPPSCASQTRCLRETDQISPIQVTDDYPLLVMPSTPVWQKTLKVKRLKSNQKYSLTQKRNRQLTGRRKHHLKQLKVPKRNYLDMRKRAIRIINYKKYYTDQQYQRKLRQHSINKYKLNYGHLRQVRQQSIKKYRQNPEHKENVKQRSIKKYRQNPEHRENVKQQRVQKYRHNPENKENTKQQSIQKYRQNPEHRENVKQQRVQKYRHNPENKENTKQQSIQKYRQNPEHRENVKQQSIQKYRQNPEHRENVKQQSIQKYRQNPEHRENVKQQSIQKYTQNPEHRENVKQQSIQKYKQNPEHQEEVKQQNIQKYKENPVYQARVKQASFDQYERDDGHREMVKRSSMGRYENDQVDREHRNQPKRRRLYTSKKRKDIVDIFKEETKYGPEYVCSCCCKSLFHNQVVKCSLDRYSEETRELADQCISDLYMHTCSESCCTDCELKQSPCGSSWICHTCDRKLKQGKKPAESHSNGLGLCVIPDELSLNSLEQQLIALRLAFSKMVLLPKGGQHGVHGAVVSIPNNIDKCLAALPRNDSAETIIKVKLKRKLAFKGHAAYQFVNPWKLHAALEYLKNTNPLYRDIVIDMDSFENPVPEVEDDSIIMMEEDDDVEDVASDEEDSIFATSVQEEGLQLGTCLQPVDIGQDILDHDFNKIFCLAPGEGSHPVKVLQESENEAMTFPTLFPDGTGTYNQERDVRITLHRYFVNRMLHADSRFSRNIPYIFYAQYLNELQNVISSVSVALRKGQGRDTSDTTVTAAQLTDGEYLKNLLRSDKAYRFLKPVRGTPAYWQGVLRDLLAAIAQLGKPTWFITFSSAEFRWPEIINTILRQEGDSRQYCDLTGAEKAEVLRRNPVTSTRMFDRRLQTILKSIIKGPTNPIGEIVDHFYRIEFHLRGAPHVHMLLWVKDAPQLDVNTDEEVIDFVDQYVSCNLPTDTNSKLYEQVSSVQMHSKTHTKSCRIKNTVCRFNFPKSPSLNTFISRQADHLTHLPDLDHTEVILTAQNLLKSVADLLASEGDNVDSLSDIFDVLGITQGDFEEACNVLTKRTSIVLKRNIDSEWVNNYNPVLLSCFDSNMDIQYITDIYACVSYVVKYISKSETQMGHVLQAADREAREGNLDAFHSMKKIGGVYLTHREVSAQEAIYRLCELNLKEFSRKVQFVPVGSNPVRFCKPLSVLRACEENDEDVWLPSIIDRYKCRPRQAPFSTMCLGTFCSEYRVLASSEKTTGNNVHQLRDDRGYICKRTRSSAAVLRYPKFSPVSNTEEYYLSMMQLFLPFWEDSDLKPDGFSSYEVFYQEGEIIINSNRLSVQQVTEENKRQFQGSDYSSGDLEELMNDVRDQEEVWSSLFPGQEQDRLECEMERPDVDNEEIEQEDLSELGHSTVSQHVGGVEISTTMVSDRQAHALLQSLNQKQREIFYTIRNHFNLMAQGLDVNPFYMFLTGPGGCGKSHLIKCLMYEVERIFAPHMSSPDDASVLLAAPTGVSAFNIGAKTIHSALGISIKTPKKYKPLGEERVNTLRAKYAQLQLLIVDEVSLVNKRLLFYIDKRLQQIKQSRDIFGKTSVLAIGDFYQLPPVRGSPLYKSGTIDYLDIWNDNFKVVELTQIMRQTDGSQFAEMLKRLRERENGDKISSSDLKILESCTKNVVNDQSLHVFPRNRNVNDHNKAMLNKYCTVKFSIQAQDYKKNLCTGRMTPTTKQTDDKMGDLVTCLQLGVGAKVTLMRNLDVEDGLVNGARGTVVRIDHTNDQSQVSAIGVVFDDSRVGQNTLAQQANTTGIIIIQRREEFLEKDNIVRRQFPLALSWATSVHKTQGLTLDEIAVSLKETFVAGQAYVALSRVKSQNGLCLLDSSFGKIYCKKEVKQYLARMPKFPLLELIPLHANENEMLISLLNVEGLLAHWHDFLKGNYLLENSDIFCLTETWLNETNTVPQIETFDCFEQCRFMSYDDDSLFKRKKGGGVAIYVKSAMQYKRLFFQTKNIEYLAIIDSKDFTLVCVVYRPPSYKLSEFMKQFKALMEEIIHTSALTYFVLGDFNQDLRQNSGIRNFMEPFGHEFVQLVKESTTTSGSILDHVYVSDLQERNYEVTVLPIYFGFHKMVQIKSYRDDLDENVYTFTVNNGE